MDKKQATYLSRWFIKNRLSLIDEIGDYAAHKLQKFLESQGVDLQPKHRGRPKANVAEFIIAGDDIKEHCIYNAILNWRVRNAGDMARLFGIISTLGYCAPGAPMMAFYNLFTSVERLPWETGPICTYKAFTEACSNKNNAPKEADLRKFDNLVCEMAFFDRKTILEKESGWVDDYIIIDDEPVTTDEYNDYIRWLYEQAGE